MRYHAALFALIATAPLSAQSGAASADVDRFTRGFGSEVRNGFARARAATAGFVSLDSAVATGYQGPGPKCIADEHHGAMGYHHINRGYVDQAAEPDKPEFLLYERLADGRYRLNGVEYIVPYRFWPADSTPPTIMGQTMKQENNLKYWYLHMWIWKENSAGLFADWDPEVRCHDPQ